MQKCPFTIKVSPGQNEMLKHRRLLLPWSLCPILPMSVGQNRKLNPRVPLFLGFGPNGERHILESWPDKSQQDRPAGDRTMTLMDVAVDGKTGRQIQANPIRASDLRFQLRELLNWELDKPEPWQELVAIETEWLIRNARSLVRKNWILNTGCILAEHGKRIFFGTRERLSAYAQSGWLRQRKKS